MWAFAIPALLLAAFVPLAASAGGSIPGSLDRSFGNRGVVTTAIGPRAFATAVVLQSNGKIVAAGVIQENGTGYDFGLARYNANGSLDETFGSGGIVATDFGSDEGAHALVLEPDGEIVVAGGSGTGSGAHFALARYNPDGSLDPSFGGNGKVTTDFGPGEGAGAVALALQPDGKIIAVGSVSTNGTGFGSDFALARYKPDGSLDGSFGSGGVVTTDFFGGTDRAWALLLQPNGKIVAVGGSEAPGGMGAAFTLARYNPDGSLDPSFGTGGRAWTEFDSGYAEAYAAALEPDGKIVAAGYDYHFALARYNANGSLDREFGRGGKVTTAFPGSEMELATGVALQPNGQVLAAGDTDNGEQSTLALARYKAKRVPRQVFRH